VTRPVAGKFAPGFWQQIFFREHPSGSSTPSRFRLNDIGRDVATPRKESEKDSNGG
jgi:hypothetical protein